MDSVTGGCTSKRANDGKIGIPLQTPVLLYKSGVQAGYTFHGHVPDVITGSGSQAF